MGWRAIVAILASAFVVDSCGQADKSDCSGNNCGWLGGPDASGDNESDATPVDDASGGGQCSPGAVRCSGRQSQRCNASGTWETAGPICPYACSGGVCSGVCVPASLQCSGQQPQKCDATGAWQNTGTACSGVCNAGACAGSCMPGATQCSDNGVATCSSSGQFGTAVPCTNQTCINGACKGVCAPGQSQCNGLVPQTCDGAGGWQDGNACPYECVQASCAGACSPGSTQSCGVCGTNGTATCTDSYAWGACAPPSGVCAFMDQGCSTQCDTPSSCWPHVDRSYDQQSGMHFYTNSDSEAACCGFTVEAYNYFYLYATQQSGLVQFYRCLLSTGSHLYTTSSNCEGAAGARVEGALGYIAQGPTCGSIPLYRLRGPTGDHFYTISSGDVSAAEAGGYVSEGVSGYVWTSPES